MKECTKCGIEKEFDEFHKDKNKKDGHRSHCKSCIKKYRAENKEKIAKYGAENKEKRAKYRAENKEKRAKYRAENKEKIAKSKAKWRAENKEKIAKYGAKFRAENPEKLAKRKAKYYAENKEEVAKSNAKSRAKKKSEQPNCIYQIKNLENNKVYIGETTRGEVRWKEHLRDLRGNRHPNKLLQEDFDKYGEEAFDWTILKEFEDEDKSVLLLEEARSIEQFIAEDVELYNLTLTIDQLRMLTENK